MINPNADGSYLCPMCESHTFPKFSESDKCPQCGWSAKTMHKCPVCNEHYFPEPDSFHVCNICGWEDDGLQESEPDYSGGANVESLNECRKKWLEKNN